MRFFRMFNWDVVFCICAIIITLVVICFYGSLVYPISCAWLTLGYILQIYKNEKYKRLYEEYKGEFEKIKERDNSEFINGLTYKYTIEDRAYLLLLMAKSFYKAGKLIIEKKHPNARNAILTFQLINGNIRFSVLESSLPDYMLEKNPIRINTDKINYAKNYRIIKELLNRED